MRTLARYRAELIERRAPHINHMIQALKHMNIQLNLVLTDITGVSGLAMLRAIIAGERDPQHLAVFRQPGCKHSEAEIVKALTGTWDDAHVFILKQSVELFDSYATKLVDVMGNWNGTIKPWNHTGKKMHCCPTCRRPRVNRTQKTP